MDTFKKQLVLLHHCRGIGWKGIQTILAFDPQLEKIMHIPIKQWQLLLPFLPPSQLSLFHSDLHRIPIEEKIRQYTYNGIEMLTPFDLDYPSLLTHIYDPPWVLYMKGNKQLLAELKPLAVVGPRKPSEYGKMAIDQLLPPLVRQNYVIVSGLAAGIDAYAHQCAIQEGGKTIAIMAGGLFHIYPRENISLGLDMMRSQLVISETVPFQKAQPFMFPMRNRIISGMSLAVLIVEAKSRSGSLITAQTALEQGRDVFAVPGSIFSERSSGTNLLIQEGAKLILRPEDIEEEIVRN
ncbi:DNA-processing protein DprA [Bacillus sp. 1P06AnD]|uniref:DNA-processing protein DprA n=1 Tax=Bacillus sp. 1P06AnD TaxID=3132208 RepID=UPI0039A2E9E5